jgi:aryl-alcohol dehydrogenase-like predicted oxidoreductase
MVTLVSLQPNLLPRIAVGCMNFGKRTPEAESARILARAVERGVTWLDTANVYNEGESERIVGRAIAKDRARFFVATKVGYGRPGGKLEGLSPARVKKAIDESLDRLKTDRVELYYLHGPDPMTPIGETIAAMGELIRAGKVRAWGMSNFASWQVLEAMHVADAQGVPRPAVAQQMYNAMIRQLDVEWFRFARTYTIHTTVYNPLAGGLLTGKHARSTEPEKGSRFDGNRLYQKRYWSERMFDFVEAFAAIAKDEGKSLVDLAYEFCATRPGVDSILLGPATVAQLDAGIDACERKTLSEAAKKKLDELHVAFQGTDATYAR